MTETEESDTWNKKRQDPNPSPSSLTDNHFIECFRKCKVSRKENTYLRGMYYIYYLLNVNTNRCKF